MESYLRLHRPQSEHRSKISEALGQNLRHSYSKTSTTHRALTLSYSRSRQNCAQQPSCHSIYGQGSRSRLQISEDYDSGGYRSRYRDRSVSRMSSASGSKSLCRLPVPENSNSLMRSRSRPKTSISRQSTDISSCDEHKSAVRKVQRGRQQSRTAFARIHEKYKIKQDYSVSASSSRSNINVRIPYGHRNPRSKIPADFDSGSETEYFGGREKVRLRFPDVPVNLNDSREFQELMDYTTSVLGENKKYETETKKSPPILQENYKDSNFSRSTSLSSINSAMWKHATEFETDDEEEWLTQALLHDSGILTTPTAVEVSEVITSTGQTTPEVQNGPEAQWWYDYVEPKSGQGTNSKRSADEPLNLERKPPSQNLAKECFIGASIARKYRSRYRGMFNPSPRILDKAAQDHTIPNASQTNPNQVLDNGTQPDHPKFLPVPSKGVKIKRSLSPYISSTMMEFGSIGTENTVNLKSLPEVSSECLLDNVGQLSNYSSIREAHKRRERQNGNGQRPDSVLKKSSYKEIRIETQAKNKERTHHLEKMPTDQKPGIRVYQYDWLKENHYDCNTEDVAGPPEKNVRQRSEFPCAKLPPLPDVILSDISLNEPNGLDSISEPDSLGDYGMTDTDDSADESASNIVLEKFIEDIAKSYPEESGTAFLSDTEDEGDSMISIKKDKRVVASDFDKTYFGDDSFTRDKTVPLKPEKVKHSKTKNYQQDKSENHDSAKSLLADFDEHSHSDVEGETFSSYSSPGHMASYELYASEIETGMPNHTPNVKENLDLVGIKMKRREQFTAICCPKNSTWSSRERTSFKPVHKTEEERFYSEEINEDSREDSAHKGHLLPGGLEKAQVNVKGIITHSYEPRIADEKSEQSDQDQEDDPTDDGETKKGEHKTAQNSDNGKKSEQTSKTSDTSSSSPQTVSTSQQATVNNQSVAGTSTSTASKKPKGTTKKSQHEDQNQNPKKTTGFRPKTSVPTNANVISNVKVIRGTQSAPAKVLISGLRNPRTVAEGQNQGQSNSKPVPVRVKVVPIKTTETNTVRRDRERKSPTKKVTKRSKKKKSEVVTPKDDNNEPVAGPSNIANAEILEEITITTNATAIPLPQGLPPPRPTLIQGSKLGKSQDKKSTRHVSIKLPDYAVESGTFEPSQYDEDSKPEDDLDSSSKSVRILIPVTNDPSGFRSLGSVLDENPITSSNYRSSIGSVRPGTPGPSSANHLQNSSGHYTFIENSPGNLKSGASVDENQQSPSPTSLRAKANQSGYFGLLMRQRKLTEHNGSNSSNMAERLPISRNAQESLLPPPPLIVTPAPVEPIWNEVSTTAPAPVSRVEKAKPNVNSKAKSNVAPAAGNRRNKK